MKYIWNEWLKYVSPVLVILLFVLIMVACGQSNNLPSVVKQENIRYFHDSRTDLCFAATNSSTKDGWDVTSITNVPCTDKVLEIIHQ